MAIPVSNDRLGPPTLGTHVPQLEVLGVKALQEKFNTDCSFVGFSEVILRDPSNERGLAGAYVSHLQPFKRGEISTTNTLKTACVSGKSYHDNLVQGVQGLAAWFLGKHGGQVQYSVCVVGERSTFRRSNYFRRCLEICQDEDSLCRSKS